MSFHSYTMMCCFIEYLRDHVLKQSPECLAAFCLNAILGFPARDQQPCFSTKTKESVCIIVEFNSRRIGWGHKYGRRFFVLGHKHGDRDVM